MTGDPAQRWAADLASWAIPAGILAAAPESPWGFPVELFVRRDKTARSPTPSALRAAEAIPSDGSVLDVGCGAGAASHALVPPAGRIIGVDESEQMLAAFASAARAPHIEVAGRWPDVAPDVEITDVVVCHHVLYNVPDIEPFVVALADHARRRVVIEIYEEHPVAWMNPLWRDLHGIDRPDRPHAADALAVIKQRYPAAQLERWDAPAADRSELDDVVFAFLRRRLCLSPDRDDELRAALERTPPPSVRRAATIWWD